MGVPPDLLIKPSELSRFGVPSAFLAQFAARPILLTITTAGTLGTMQFVWQFVGDSQQSAPIVSSSGTTWVYTIDDNYVDVTFPSGTYLINATYSIDTNGNVTNTGGGPTVTAAFFDLRQNACSSVTTEAMYRMRDAIRPPLLTFGDDTRTHAAAWVFAKLKRAKGATPEGAGTGDENVFTAEKLAIEFFDKIGEDGKPDSMTDTSTSDDGPLIPMYPTGDSPRGW